MSNMARFRLILLIGLLMGLSTDRIQLFCSDEAIWKRSLQIDDRNLISSIQLCNVYWRSKRWKEAQRVLIWPMLDFPGHNLVLINAAWVYLNLGENEDARRMANLYCQVYGENSDPSGMMRAIADKKVVAVVQSREEDAGASALAPGTP